jgi:uncharacterized protein YacL
MQKAGFIAAIAGVVIGVVSNCVLHNTPMTVMSGLISIIGIIAMCVCHD